jgi:hypothetical protein
MGAKDLGEAAEKKECGKGKKIYHERTLNAK